MSPHVHKIMTTLTLLALDPGDQMDVGAVEIQVGINGGASVP